HSDGRHLIVTVKATETLVVRLASPPKTTVMLCLPLLSLAVENTATPLLRVPVPSTVVPSMKVTTPLGRPAPGARTLIWAVKVIDCPNTTELADVLRAAVVAACLTVWVKAAEVLPGNVASPP